MRRIGLAVALTLGLTLAPLAGEAQQQGRVYRIGFLAATPQPHLSEAFSLGLRDLGWIEGQNITIEYRDAGGRLERLPDLAAQLVRLNVDLIVAQAGPETDAAKRATESIPIVFLIHGDPVGVGHVASLARPGGNVTGTGGFFPDLAAKRLELLKQTLPSLTRVAVLWNSANPIKHLDWKAIQEAGHALDLSFQSWEVKSGGD